MRLDELLKEMDIAFFGTSQHGVGPDGTAALIKNKDVFFLDVRTHEEYKFLQFPFTHHIPLNELPDRLEEVPKDKLIITFCSSIVRAAIAYTYLLEKGYEKVKIFLGTSEQLATLLKPKPVYKNLLK